MRSPSEATRCWWGRSICSLGVGDEFDRVSEGGGDRLLPEILAGSVGEKKLAHGVLAVEAAAARGVIIG